MPRPGCDCTPEVEAGPHAEAAGGAPGYRDTQKKETAEPLCSGQWSVQPESKAVPRKLRQAAALQKLKQTHGQRRRVGYPVKSNKPQNASYFHAACDEWHITRGAA